MKNEQGFSLIELLIVVAIIAIIAAIAVPSLLTSRMAANEASAIQGCRTVGSAEIAYAATSNQQFAATLGVLTGAGFLDKRFDTGIDGYTYAAASVTVSGGGTAFTNDGANFGVVATPAANMGRFLYGIGTDQVVRFEGAASGFTAPTGLATGDGLGTVAAGSRP
jgi:type IV pilus assembly protein PilA